MCLFDEKKKYDDDTYTERVASNKWKIFLLLFEVKFEIYFFLCMCGFFVQCRIYVQEYVIAEKPYQGRQLNFDCQLLLQNCHLIRSFDQNDLPATIPYYRLIFSNKVSVK